MPSRALPALVAALRSDPFYCAITVDYEADAEARDRCLSAYFSLAIEDAVRFGKVTTTADPTQGCAIWTLPVSPADAAAHARHRHVALGKILGPRGLQVYDAAIEFMRPRAAVVPTGSWYLSILGVDPQVQGRGLGVQLLMPTLVEADAAGTACYLETFTPRNIPFYARLGFQPVGRHSESATGSEYQILLRSAASKSFPDSIPAKLPAVQTTTTRPANPGAGARPRVVRHDTPRDTPRHAGDARGSAATEPVSDRA